MKTNHLKFSKIHHWFVFREKGNCNVGFLLQIGEIKCTPQNINVIVEYCIYLVSSTLTMVIVPFFFFCASGNTCTAKYCESFAVKMSFLSRIFGMQSAKILLTQPHLRKKKKKNLQQHRL